MQPRCQPSPGVKMVSSEASGIGIGEQVKAPGTIEIRELPRIDWRQISEHMTKNRSLTQFSRKLARGGGATFGLAGTDEKNGTVTQRVGKTRDGNFRYRVALGLRQQGQQIGLQRQGTGKLSRRHPQHYEEQQQPQTGTQTHSFNFPHLHQTLAFHHPSRPGHHCCCGNGFAWYRHQPRST